MIESKCMKLKKYINIRISILLFFFILLFVFRIEVFSETPLPENTEQVQDTASPEETNLPEETPNATDAEETLETTNIPTTEVPTDDPVVEPTEEASDSPEISPTEEATPTPTPTPEYLYEFTIPPRESSKVPAKTIAPNITLEPTMSIASIDVVKVNTIIPSKNIFRWSYLIKVAAIIFFIMAFVSIGYGLICIIFLLIMKKDITIGAILKRRREKRKAREKRLGW